MAGKAFKAAAVGGQAQACQYLAASAAMLLKQDDQRLFARQNFFQHRHVASFKGDGLVLQQAEQLRGRCQVIVDQLQQIFVVHVGLKGFKRPKAWHWPWA